MDYHWYQEVGEGEKVLQGDFIPRCPIIIPPSNLNPDGGEVLDLKVELIDAIVLSQSCDLEHGKIDIVLVCPYLNLDQFVSLMPTPHNKREIEKKIKVLKQGNLNGYHLLNKPVVDTHLVDYQVVDFRNVYGIHIGALNQIASKINPRLRLLPPYREHLSQAFARHFMRVGLPQDFRVDKYNC